MPLKPDGLRFLDRHIEITGSVAPEEITPFIDGVNEVLGYPDTIVNAQTAAVLVANFKDRNVKVPIDFEHSTKFKAGKGEPSPAAGWISALRYEPGRGIVATCEWMPDAKKMIEGGQYKYLSPHWQGDEETGGPEILFSVALTNTPRIKNMPELIAASMAAFDVRKTEKKAMPTIKEQLSAALDAVAERIEKFKESLVKSGKIKDDATFDNVLSAAFAPPVDGLEVTASIADRLSLPKTATPKEIIGKIDEIQKTTVDAAEYKKVTERLASLESTERERTAGVAVESAVKARKINPNNAKQMEWAKTTASKSPEVFASWCESAPELWQEGSVTGTSTKPVGEVHTRKSIITASIGEWSANKDKIGCTREAFVNLELKQKGEKALSAEEIKALEV